MPQARWIRYEPAGIKAEGAETLRGLARQLSPLSNVADLSERAELAERERAKAAAELRKTTCARAAAAFHILVDLLKQGWSVKAPRCLISIQRPAKQNSPEDERNYARQQLHAERDEQLREPATREFVHSMETQRLHDGRRCSVFSLMRDGREFAKALRHARDADAWDNAIRPYLQFVRADDTCAHTGLRMVDIWRYFRHTWANPYKSVPGRTMMILVRDAAAPFHPVMGLAALSSATVGLTVRDEFIGWTMDRVRRGIREQPNKRHVSWFLSALDEAIREIYIDDLMRDGVLTLQDLKQPTSALVKHLADAGEEHREEHHRLMQSTDYKPSNPAEMLREGYFREQAETLLFRAKREEELAALLRARLTLFAALGPKPTGNVFAEFIANGAGRDTLARVIRKIKADRVGNAIADLTVCGAVAPYNELLAGKLVAMLMASPEVREEYHARYAGTPSIIASSMAGKQVHRPAELAFISTTSLYGQRPNQYDRIAIPGAIWHGDREVRYQFLGRTEGKGTYQFNAETMKAIGRMLAQTRGGQRVNYVFGEGVNPRLRHLREGLDELRLPADELLRHGTPRLIYALSLIENLSGYLLGMEPRPKWIVPGSRNAGTALTRGVVQWWRERWMKNRLERPETLSEIEKHTLVHPITHGARVRLPETDFVQMQMF